MGRKRSAALAPGAGSSFPPALLLNPESLSTASVPFQLLPKSLKDYGAGWGNRRNRDGTAPPVLNIDHWGEKRYLTPFPRLTPFPPSCSRRRSTQAASLTNSSRGEFFHSLLDFLNVTHGRSPTMDSTTLDACMPRLYARRVDGERGNVHRFFTEKGGDGRKRREPFFAENGRGRDGHCRPSPAQIRTGGITAYGSYLG